MSFAQIAVLDWSAARGPRLGANSIWLGLATGTDVQAHNIASRAEAEQRLHVLVEQALTSGSRLLIGADFAFGYPIGFARTLTGQPQALAVWRWLAGEVHDAPGNASNYRAVAARINASFAGEGPFWGNGERLPTPGLPRLKPPLPTGLAQHRATDLAARESGASPKPVWQLAGAGAVGAQVLTGLPVLHRLRVAFPGVVAVWPFELACTPVVLAEVYPSLLAPEVRALVARTPGLVADAAQVHLLALALARLAQTGGLAPLLAPPAPPATLAEEGWILGAGHAAHLQAALSSW